MLNLLENEIKKIVKVNDFLNFQKIETYINFFMIFLLNLKSNINFILKIFDKKNNFFHKIINILNKLPNNIKVNVLSILNNIFISEYKNIFFRSNSDKNLEEIFIQEQTNFLEKKFEVKIFYENSNYKIMYDNLLKFDISFENFFNNNIEIPDKSLFRLCLSQNLIHVIFSKKKSIFYKSKNSKEFFYEYYLLKKIVYKNIQETKKIYGDEYKTLFRKEDICDDIIKYMFFIFGNTMFIESFINPLNKIINFDKIERNITKNEYDDLINEMIKNLKISMPLILKILLKFVYNSVNENFKIEKDNYSPLYTLLFFNFINSPKIHAMYNININCNFIKQIVKLINNTTLNLKFKEIDSLNIFNDNIEKNYQKFKKFMKENILSIDIEKDEIKYYLKDLFSEKNLIYPKYLFYWDSKLLCEVIYKNINKKK
jgi:hypothetical protein